MFPEKDNELAAQALRYWANYIQTGDITLTPGDCKRLGEDYRIEALSPEQMKLIVELHELADDLTTGEKIIKE